MADINRNEEKVPAPEEIHGLAAALDQFGADFDPYEYMDTVEDKEQNIRDTEAMLLAGKTDGLKNYLLGFIDDDRDPQAVQAAQELMKRLEEIIPQNALRTAEMSMEQNCNMIDGILNNLPNPEEVGLSIDGGSRYLAIQTCDSGYDYTFFNQDAEVKALASGDPRIMEKTELDGQVTKLKLLKANHESQRYALEDNLIKFYPQAIKREQETIADLETDIRHLEAHTPPDKEHFSMTVMGTTYTEKKEAGQAIIAAFESLKDLSDKVELGEYRGFPMTLWVSDSGLC